MNFPQITHNYQLSESEREAFLIKDRPRPSEWANENLTLVAGGYGIHGKLKLKPWQIEPVDAIEDWQRIIFCAPTRLGKSLLSEVIMFYGMYIYGINGVLCYAEDSTASLAFRTKIKPMIEKNEALLKLTTGNADDLTQDRIFLKNCFWKVASAQNRNSLASFGAAFVIGSEVAKWVEMDYNPIKMLYGRQDDYPQYLRKSILESSGGYEGGYFHQEIFRRGTLIVEPFYPCPHCGKYQTLTDRQIRVIGDASESNLKQAARLREEKEKSCRYECVYCKGEITEIDRVKFDDKVVWAAPLIDDKDRGFFQPAEDVDLSGKIISGNRNKYDTICFHWNRLVDLNFTFYECLARLFDSKNNPEDYFVYETETMARFWKKKVSHVDISFVEGKKAQYFSCGENAFIPDEALILTGGIDSQDNGFYYLIQGWGDGLESWVVRYGFIAAPFESKTTINDLIQQFKAAIFSTPLKYANGTEQNIRLCFQDRGGHRADDVDAIAQNIPFIKPYVGLTRSDPKKPLIYKSENGEYFLGQSETLSEYVSLLMDTDKWHIPADASLDLMNQVIGQYHAKKRDSNGNTKSLWIKTPNDHYRSCLNMSYAAAKALNLDTALFRPDIIDQLKKGEGKDGKPQPERSRAEQPAQRRAGYFDRAIRGGR